MASKNRIKAIVWDLDGTLIQFKIDFIKARKAAIKTLKKYRIPKNQLSLDKTILENVNASREIFKTMNYTDQEIKRIFKEVDEEIDKIEYEAAIQATLINGIDQVLEFVKAKKLKQAIYTYNSNKNAKISLEKVNLLHFFDVIAGRDDVSNPKPHPDHMLSICNKLGIKPPESLVIGDTHRDIEGAFNVGARSIAIRNKFFKAEMLQIADKVVDESEIPSKLIKAIEELLK
jgi:HAD superfamily hydrolase (TIGR01549 family)